MLANEVRKDILGIDELNEEELAKLFEEKSSRKKVKANEPAPTA